MADTNTANIGLLLPDLNDTFNFGAHVENNFTTIDGLIGAVQCTSTTRPTNTYAGQIIYETDSKRYVQNTGTKSVPAWTYMSHRALNGVVASLPTLGLQNGDLYYATDSNALLICDGGIFRYKTNVAVASSARPTAVEAGATIYETDTGRSMVYNGSNWVPAGRMIMAAPTTTSTNGTPTSGTTETFDAVLGYHQASLISGRRYKVTLNGYIANGSIAADAYSIQIRDSQSSSNPTSASTQIAMTNWYCPAAGTTGRGAVPLSQSFLCTVTGTHTFGVSATRIGGTGVLTPVGTRELLVEDMGAAY